MKKPALRGSHRQIAMLYFLLISVSGCATANLQEAAAKNDRSGVKTRLKQGENVNARDGKGWTALHYASANGHAKLAAQLMAAGAQVDARTPDGLTPLHLAAMNNHASVIKALMAYGASLNLKANDGHTPLRTAVDHKSAYAAEVLLKAQALNE